MRYLLDTMVLSETGKRRRDEIAMAWLAMQDRGEFYVSVLTFGEIYAGIERKRSGDSSFGGRLDGWAANVRSEFADRTIPVTTEIALRWASLSARLGRRDLDLLIAATALEHDLTVATRNVRHFEPTGVKLCNPYEA